MILKTSFPNSKQDKIWRSWIFFISLWKTQNFTTNILQTKTA